MLKTLDLMVIKEKFSQKWCKSESRRILYIQIKYNVVELNIFLRFFVNIFLEKFKLR